MVRVYVNLWCVCVHACVREQACEQDEMDGVEVEWLCVMSLCALRLEKHDLMDGGEHIRGEAVKKLTMRPRDTGYVLIWS